MKEYFEISGDSRLPLSQRNHRIKCHGEFTLFSVIKKHFCATIITPNLTVLLVAQLTRYCQSRLYICTLTISLKCQISCYKTTFLKRLSLLKGRFFCFFFLSSSAKSQQTSNNCFPRGISDTLHALRCLCSF